MTSDRERDDEPGNLGDFDEERPATLFAHDREPVAHPVEVTRELVGFPGAACARLVKS